MCVWGRGDFILEDRQATACKVSKKSTFFIRPSGFGEMVVSPRTQKYPPPMHRRVAGDGWVRDSASARVPDVAEAGAAVFHPPPLHAHCSPPPLPEPAVLSRALHASQPASPSLRGRPP